MNGAKEIKELSVLLGGIPFIDPLSVTPEEEAEQERLVKEYEEAEAKKNEDTKKGKFISQYKSEKSGVNRKFWDMKISDYRADTENEKHALETVQNFIEQKGNSLLMMYGKYGTGKTMLGSLIIRECGGFYTTSFRMCLEYESSSDFKAKRSKVEVFDFYGSTPMLVIDEFGTGGKQATEKELIANIIDMRYENDLPTVLISNLDKKQIIGILGNRIFDRLKEICTSIEFTGESKREKKL